MNLQRSSLRWPRRVATMLLLAVAGSGGGSAWAAQPDWDLLALPSRKTGQAAHTLQTAVALAGERLVSVGERGIALYSDDAGKTWTQAGVPVSVTLTGVRFVNARIGWAVGHDGVVLRSDDGGQHWRRQFDGGQANVMVSQAAAQRVLAARSAVAAAAGAAAREVAQKLLEQAEFALDDAKSGASFGPSRPLLGLWFASETEGYVVGSYGQIFRTTDGGQQWQFLGARVPNPDGLHLNAIEGNGRGTLLVVAEAGKVFRSDDRGETWRAQATGYNGPLYGVLDLGDPQARTLLAFGFAGRVFQSTDGGAQWSAVGTDQKRPTLVAGARLPGNALLLLGQEGSLWRSADAGLTFQAAGRAPVLRVAGLTLLPGATGFAVAGLGGISVGPLSTRP